MFLYFPPLSLNIRRRCFQRVQLQFRACLCKQGINSKRRGHNEVVVLCKWKCYVVVVVVARFFPNVLPQLQQWKKNTLFSSTSFTSYELNDKGWITHDPPLWLFPPFNFTLCSRQVQHWHKIYRLGTEGETGQKKSNRIRNSYFKNHLDILFKNIMISW